MPTYSITSFTDKLLEFINEEKFASKITITLDTKLFSSNYGISIRPLRVLINDKSFDMKQLIDIFDNKVPYIVIKENRYRILKRSPQILIVYLSPKEYNHHKYYQYDIIELLLNNEIKRYEAIKEKAYQQMKEYYDSLEKTIENDSTFFEPLDNEF